MLTQTRLRELLDYDPETGTFVWRFPPSAERHSGRRRMGGKVAGVTCRYGYTIISVDNERLRASRLAWLYMTGEWPKQIVDLINGDRGDDRWANLREATYSQNNQNMTIRSDNTSGVKGVGWNKRQGKWHARVKVNGQLFHCGYFDSLEEAQQARNAKAALVHGEFARFESLNPSSKELN